MDIDQTSRELLAYVNSEGRIKYDKPMRVTSICNLDIFYFPFDEQNCTLTFSSFMYTGEQGARQWPVERLREGKCWKGPALEGIGKLRGKFHPLGSIEES